MDQPLILYSTNTLLAYSIAERFYRGVHYAWCSPMYDGARSAAHITIPPSSSPAEIYRTYAEDARRGDRHSEAFERNRRGIRRGAKINLARGVLTQAARDEIVKIAQNAGPNDFRPVLYIIPFDRVVDRVVEVPVSERAHPLSVEYRIEDLPRHCFDMIELRS
jgi:hypothetical protein